MHVRWTHQKNNTDSVAAVLRWWVAADAPADAADGEDAAVAADGEVAAGEAAGEEKKKRASSVTTKTKTGGGEHTRFASTPATTDEFRGDSDMGSDSDGRDLVAEVG